MLIEDTLLLGGLAVALALSIGNLRAWGWLAAIATSYAISAIWWRVGLPGPAFIGGALDALICLGIYFWGRLRWEMVVWRLFQLSVLVNLITLAGDYGYILALPHGVHSTILEAINWLALAWIGGTGAVQNVGAAHATGSRFMRHLLGFVASLHRERTQPPFTQCRGKATTR